MITTGERRWRAAKVAGLKQIPVIIGDPEEERTRRVKSLISNVQREDLSALELSHALQEMKDDNPDVKTNRDLSGVIGKSEQWIGQMLKILNLPATIQDEIRKADRVIPYDSVVEIARLENEQDQVELLKHVMNGANVREVREKARDAKPARAGKAKAKFTQKVATSNGWVIIHCQKTTASKADCLTALQEATKIIKGVDF